VVGRSLGSSSCTGERAGFFGTRQDTSCALRGAWREQAGQVEAVQDSRHRVSEEG
jgi:hypothetical protein